MIGNSAKTLSEFTALGIVICRNKNGMEKEHGH